jgi:hypothetical protein
MSPVAKAAILFALGHIAFIAMAIVFAAGS